MTSKNQSKHISKDRRRRNAARRARQSARQSADQTAFVHRFFHTLRKRIAKPEKRCRRSATGKGNERSVDADRSQRHAERNLQNEYPRRSQHGFVDQNLCDHTNKTANQKRFEQCDQKFQIIPPRSACLRKNERDGQCPESLLPA